MTHIAARDSLTVLAAYAAATSRIGLGTGVVPIYTRTPATMAHDRGHAAGAVGRAPAPGAWASRTARSSRAGTARRSTSRWPRCASTSPSCARSSRGEPPPAGEKWQTSFALSGIGPYPELPIYVAALSPAMLRLAGEVADGVDAVAVQPRVHPRRRHARAAGGARAGGQDDGGLRRRGRRPVGRGRRPAPSRSRRCAETCCPTSACRSTARCSSARASRRTSPPTTRPPARGDGEGMQAAISERFLRDAVRHRRRPTTSAPASPRYQRRRRHVAVRGSGRQDRLRGDAAGGGARVGAAAASATPLWRRERLKHHRGEAARRRAQPGRSGPA